MIRVNGEPSSLASGDTVATVLHSLGLDPDARGVAVAVDGEVVSRSEWGTLVLRDDARVEVLTAMQGG